VADTEHEAFREALKAQAQSLKEILAQLPGGERARRPGGARRMTGTCIELPQELAHLRTLALDLRWSWSHVADALWEHIDPVLWRRTRNPWLILQTVGAARLRELAAEPRFRALLEELERERQAAHGSPAWFARTHPDGRLRCVAYFSMEYGLTEGLPVYSGGLGVLAADHLKTASELGVPLVAVGLLYQQGYFRQGLDPSGAQLAFFPFNDPTQLPVQPLRDAGGEWLHVAIPLPGRALWLRAWEVQVGRVRLCLLDSNSPLNSPPDRGITSELYGGGPGLRLQQEMVLGIGGYRLLETLGHTPDVCHLNEGHSAFAVLERARYFMQANDVPFAVALNATRAGNLFTTHTPVEAGFDRFTPELFAHTMGPYAAELGLPMEALLALGRARPEDAAEPFQMAWLALHGAGAVNGVSRLHGAVSRGLFQPLFPRWPTPEVPVGHVTNGVHVPSWDSPAADRLWTQACGKARWREASGAMETAIRALDDRTLWELRSENRRRLVEWARRRLARQSRQWGPPIASPETALDPDVLTLGFARRFATYKRPNLLLHDPDRLERLLRDPRRPVQLLVAGKAHPLDRPGQALIQTWNRFIRDRGLHHRVVFLVDYDLDMAEHLTAGADLWINTPRRPWEACGTSGMKPLVNGGLNLSELDGWWAEAWRPGVGWALGDGGEHGDDPDWDAHEAGRLYDLLEQEVIPAFYERDAHGIPTRWVTMMRESMATLTPRFSTNRMLREYVETHYLTLAEAHRARARDHAALARDITRWRNTIERHWDLLRFGAVRATRHGERLVFDVEAYLDDLPLEAVRMEIYADPPEPGGAPEIHAAEHMEQLAGAVNGHRFRCAFATTRPPEHYTPRLVPYHPQVSLPLECPRILWQR